MAFWSIRPSNIDFFFFQLDNRNRFLKITPMGVLAVLCTLMVTGNVPKRRNVLALNVVRHYGVQEISPHYAFPLTCSPWPRHWSAILRLGMGIVF